jgi:hypothetical protein
MNPEYNWILNIIVLYSFYCKQTGMVMQTPCLPGTYASVFGR